MAVFSGHRQEVCATPLTNIAGQPAFLTCRIAPGRLVCDNLFLGQQVMTHTGGDPVQTECNTDLFDFQPLERRDIRGGFDGGTITSDAGASLLKEVEARRAIVARFAASFTDPRDPELIEHAVDRLIAQRVYRLPLGYEDLNDYHQLRHDPPLAVLVGKRDPSGQDRFPEWDCGKALAGKSTLN